MRYVTIIDTETTGVDDDAICIEVAAALFDVRHASVVESFGSLIRAEANPAAHINGIPEAMLADAPEASYAWNGIAQLAREGEAFIAHNATFDARFVPPRIIADRPWICSLNDFEWPRGRGSLINIALALGLGVATAHRAMADVDLLARCFARTAELGVDLDVMLARGLRPKALYAACVSYEQNGLAREAGFRWEPQRKLWVRRMATEDTAALPFRVKAA